MNRSSRPSRVFAFGAAAIFVSLSACSILGGSDDSNGAGATDGGSEGDAHDAGRRDSGTRRDSGSSSSDAGTLKHDDAGHVIGDDGGALLCDPQPLGSFSGGSYSPPLGPYAGVCVQADLDNFVSCATGSDTSQCAQFASGGARASCGACLLTPTTASHWGPALGTDPATSLLNASGCRAFIYFEGSSTTGCAGKTQHAINCEGLACDTTYNCAGASQTDVTTCVNNAAAGECASYESAVQTACNKDAGGAEAMCSPTDTTTLATFLGLFCGSAG